MHTKRVRQYDSDKQPRKNLLKENVPNVLAGMYNTVIRIGLPQSIESSGEGQLLWRDWIVS